MEERSAADGKGTRRGRDWTEQAACRDADPAVFTDPSSREDVAQALATCARCPVARDCLDTALAHEQIGDVGIWGGTTEAVRDRIRAGTLTRDDALHLQTTPYRPSDDRTPAVAVSPDAHGDLTDASGRVLITRLPAGDYLTLVDQRPVARSATLVAACQAAHTAQHEPAAHRPADPPSRLIDVRVDDAGDHVDATGRIVITEVPTDPPYLVFVDGRLHHRAETLNTARAAAYAATHATIDGRVRNAPSSARDGGRRRRHARPDPPDIIAPLAPPQLSPVRER